MLTWERFKLSHELSNAVHLTLEIFVVLINTQTDKGEIFPEYLGFPSESNPRSFKSTGILFQVSSDQET